jgi:hypothetical protein
MKIPPPHTHTHMETVLSNVQKEVAAHFAAPRAPPFADCTTNDLVLALATTDYGGRAATSNEAGRT